MINKALHTSAPRHPSRQPFPPAARRALSLVAMLALLLAFVSTSTPLAYASGTIAVTTTNDVVDGNTSSITALTASRAPTPDQLARGHPGLQQHRQHRR